MRLRAAGRRTTVFALLVVIAAWGVVSITSVTAFILTHERNPDNRAIIKMGVALILVWCPLGALAMYWFRDRFVRWASGIPLGRSDDGTGYWRCSCRWCSSSRWCFGSSGEG